MLASFFKMKHEYIFNFPFKCQSKIIWNQTKADGPEGFVLVAYNQTKLINQEYSTYDNNEHRFKGFPFCLC